MLCSVTGKSRRRDRLYGNQIFFAEGLNAFIPSMGTQHNTSLCILYSRDLAQPKKCKIKKLCYIFVSSRLLSKFGI